MNMPLNLVMSTSVWTGADISFVSVSLVPGVEGNRLYVASFPVPRPAFRRCLLSSDGKLGVGLGTRLGYTYLCDFNYHTEMHNY